MNTTSSGLMFTDVAKYPTTMNQTRFKQMIEWAAWRPWIKFQPHCDHLCCYQGNLNSLVVLQIIQFCMF